jgi:hypothetical protein
MDPRVRTTVAELGARDSLHLEIYRAVNALGDARARVRELRASITQQSATVRGPRADSLPNFDRQLALLEGSGGGRGGRATAAGPATGVQILSIPQLQNELMALYNVIEDADAAPTTQVVSAARSRLAQVRTALSAVRRLGTVVEARD